LEQGFGSYEEVNSSASDIDSHEDITSPSVTKRALSWIRKNRNEKLFLFVHYWDPHYDYIPPSSYDALFDPDYEGTMDGTNIEGSDKINSKMDRRDLEHIVALYDGEIRWTDMHLEEFFDELKMMGLYEDAVIIVVGDHGDEFLEHGGKGHQRTLYDEVIHVPLIIRLPALKEPSNIDIAVSIVDIVPTVLEILDLEHPSAIDGRSLMPMTRGNAPIEVKEVYSELTPKWGGSIRALIAYPWKLIHHSVRPEEYELYDIAEDPFETTDLSSHRSQVGDAMRDSLLRWIADKGDQRVASSIARIDKATHDQLKALGYVQ
jgi:arylsulfatase A-like enzyme